MQRLMMLNYKIVIDRRRFIKNLCQNEIFSVLSYASDKRKMCLPRPSHRDTNRTVWFINLVLFNGDVKEGERSHNFSLFSAPSQKIFWAKQEFREICPTRTEDSAYLETISVRVRFSFIFWGFKHFPTRPNTVEPLPQKPARREIIKYIATSLMSLPRTLSWIAKNS